jgi:tetratricopeptide (TPR) repeat protein
MKSSFLIILLSFFLATTCNTDPGFAATHTPPTRGEAEPASQQLNRPRENSSKAGAPFWRKASEQYELGRTSKNAQDRSAHFRRAEEFAQQAIKADPQGSEGYKWLAIALGAQADDASVKTQIQLSRLVKENIDKALVLNPNDDISLLVLSRWHYKVASLGIWTRAIVRVVYGGLPPASMKKSEELLLRAISIKDRISHRYCLAKVYYQMGRREAALHQLRLALTLPITIPEEAEDLDKARRKLISWK